MASHSASLKVYTGSSLSLLPGSACVKKNKSTERSVENTVIMFTKYSTDHCGTKSLSHSVKETTENGSPVFAQSYRALMVL